ncbi:hypothetical protein RA178_06335 [Shewanella oncorhynchi]|uniref:Uncharacterized protein n=1 Tax=Shewanella oncorhynchi TaxID=2726434 RepID=A0AA50Q7W7_9GAMM|nr:hypothetical protein [Shewanella oncorhynchi]WMB74230.1 hypothetical protein RA178_06335 [Shewanella oncorhynchi]
MSFGIEFLNKDNISFLGVSEQSFLYWGRIIQKSGSEPTFRPFGLPYSIDFLVYSHDDGNQLFEYVFVRAKNVPCPTYGAATYNLQGEINWHSGSYPMCVAGVSTVIVKIRATNKATPVNGKVAYLTDLYGTWAEKMGGDKWDWYECKTVANQVNTTQTQLSCINPRIGREDSPPAGFFHGGGIQNIPYIDCTKYDTLPNLPNWVG